MISPRESDQISRPNCSLYSNTAWNLIRATVRPYSFLMLPSTQLPGDGQNLGSQSLASENVNSSCRTTSLKYSQSGISSTGRSVYSSFPMSSPTMFTVSEYELCD